jgi:hypothetical protein
MFTKMEGALMQLVANSAISQNLYNPDQSLYQKKSNQFTKSAHEITSVSNFVSDSVFISRKNGDLLGECFLELTLPEKIEKLSNPYDLIKQITYEIGGSIIEQYNGKALEMISSFDREARYSVSGTKIVFPLRLCTSAQMHKFLPLISLTYHDVKIKFEVDPKVLSKKLYMTYVFLDSEERRYFAQNPRDLILTLKKMHSFDIESGSESEQQKIEMPFGKIGLRDMIFSICDSTGLEMEEPLIGAKLSLENPKWQKIDRQEYLDGNMLRNVIPMANYGVSDSRFYILQFDPTPLEVEPGGVFDLGEDLTLFLNLMLVPGKYKIQILTRSYNVFCIQSGMGKIKFQNSKTAQLED